MWKLHPSRKFVFAVDGSEFCRKSFEEVLKVIQPCDELHLVQIRNPPGTRPANSLFTTESWNANIEARFNAIFKAVLNEFTKKASLAKIKCKTVEVFGDTEEQISKYCSKESDCILIIGCPSSSTKSRMISNEKFSILFLPIDYRSRARNLRSMK